MTTSVSAPSSQLPHEQKIVQGLLHSKELAYSNYLLEKHKLPTSHRWNSLEKNLTKEVSDKSKAQALVSLEALTDRIITSSDHTYQIVEVSQKEHSEILKALQSLDMTPYKSMYKEFYPSKVTFVPGGNYPTGDFLCKVVDLGDGIASIFTSVTKKKSKISQDFHYKQEFHSVFVPHSSEHIQFRVSNKTLTSLINSSFTQLEQSFINILDGKVKVSNWVPVNVYNAIQTLFDDSKEGRVQFGMMTTSESGDDAELNGGKRKGYCARKVALKDEVNDYEYVCRALRVRYDYSDKSIYETELSITPYKRDWEAKDCVSFAIKHPENSSTLARMIEKILTRA
ncbi:hypothetical protein [Vibrio splendidus]|uniref:hypothetical protein n=1 Tax=Vibrio splendidus TaxID=29497 RepID=UPI000D3A7155|nr:hypothetical protein [Vibrio splendidus]PTO67612.1 hypothetical protein CWN81_21080 [Vibrio splendidus]